MCREAEVIINSIIQQASTMNVFFNENTKIVQLNLNLLL